MHQQINMKHAERIKQFNANLGYRLDPESDYTSEQLANMDRLEYVALTKQMKLATPQRRAIIWPQIESIKNRNGGLPPK